MSSASCADRRAGDRTCVRLASGATPIKTGGLALKRKLDLVEGIAELQFDNTFKNTVIENQYVTKIIFLILVVLQHPPSNWIHSGAR